jgi:CHAT domain-containing protein
MRQSQFSAQEERAIEIVGDGYDQARKFRNAELLYRQAIEAQRSFLPGAGDYFRLSRAGGADVFVFFDLYPRLIDALEAQGKIEEALVEADNDRAIMLVNNMVARQSPHRMQIADAPAAPGRRVDFDVQQIRRLATEHGDTIVYYRLVSFCGDGNVSFLDSDRIDIWVVRPTGDIVFIHSTPPKISADRPSRDSAVAPHALVDAIRGHLVESDGQSTEAQLSTYYKVLVEPIQPYLPKNPGDRVFIVPDRDLLLVPFYALTDARGRHLIETHTLEFVTSLRVLRLLRDRARGAPPLKWKTLAPEEVLVVGNPLMPTIPDVTPLVRRGPVREDDPLPPLPGAADEAKSVAGLFGAKALIEQEATGSAIIQRLRTARLAHFATHGILASPTLLATGEPSASLDEEQSWGAVAVAPTATLPFRSSDSTLSRGFLTPDDLPDLQAELVVLSACNTGGDVSYLSEKDTPGLPEAWLLAGARNLLITQWSVADAPTGKLMLRFYTSLRGGSGMAQSLREAMLWAKADFTDLRQWSAFLLIGAD